MRILTDTHCWLWSFLAPDRLSDAAREALASGENEVIFSSASAWEIAIKHSLGKLGLPLPPLDYIPRRCAETGMRTMSIEVNHAVRAGELPLHHRDPFDRVLIAQAQLDNLTLMTADEQLRRYDVALFWAAA